MTEFSKDLGKILGSFDFDVEDVKKVEERKYEAKHRDARICVCGHPMTRHTIVNGLVFCKPTRLECPCKTTKPVLEAEDVRYFIRRTQGPGPEHALARGIFASINAGKGVKWIIEMSCDRCNEVREDLTPAPVTQRGVISYDEPTGFDALLCRQCREEM